MLKRAKNKIALLLGYRRTANCKRFLVKYLPTSLLKFLNRRVISFVPKEIYGSEVLLIHIPKSAGTSISRALYGKSIGHQKASFIFKVDPSLRKSKISVCLIRDPLERLYSAYHFLKSGGTDDVLVDFDKLYSQTEFQNFRTFVKNWLVPNFSSIEKFDYVLWPQNWFVLDEYGLPLVEKIYTLNNIDRLEKYLMESQFIEKKIGSYNVNTSKNLYELESIKKDDEICRLVKLLYKTDYELYKAYSNYHY